MMKQDFQGFYGLDEDDFKTLWANATFIFDTNVLLNLYRYQESTTEQLIEVLKSVEARIWIPYHVALEYQRNRLKVIAEQNNKFSDVRKIVDKGCSSIKGDLENLNLQKRHSSIEPERFISDLDKAVDKFLAELEELERVHVNVIGEDRIRQRLDSLFAGHIGPIPEHQKSIDDMEKEAERRFQAKIPPGYMDGGKDKADDPLFSYNGLTYQRKYSDFIVWNQIIDYVVKLKLTDVIFVTDDHKEDWWLRIRQKGDKTISPRPELISEIKRGSNVNRFQMYSSEGFLKYAGDRLNVGVTDEAIEEVGDVARNWDVDLRHLKLLKNVLSTKRIGLSAEKAVYEWLIERHGEENVTLVPNESVDIVATIDGRTVAFEVRALHQFRPNNEQLTNLSSDAKHFVAKHNIDEFVIVLVVFDVAFAIRAKEILSSWLGRLPITNIWLGVAELNEDSGEVSEFALYGDIELGSSSTWR